jgi:hypothetical protein
MELQTAEGQDRQPGMGYNLSYLEPDCLLESFGQGRIFLAGGNPA